MVNYSVNKAKIRQTNKTRNLQGKSKIRDLLPLVA